jgi:hypothetical protein
MAMRNDVLANVATAGQNFVQISLGLHHSPAHMQSWQSSLIVFGLIVVVVFLAKSLSVAAFRAGRPALVYLFKRARSTIVDRLIEKLIIGPLAGIGVSWLIAIAKELAKIFH